MARRARIVRPDQQVVGIGPDGEDVLIACVSDEALATAMLRAATVLNFSGGVVEVATSRVPTGCQDEYVTTAAMVRWKDRTDARPQPEQEGSPVVPAVASGSGRAARIEALAERDGWECHLCHEPLERDADGEQAITFDHVIPKSHGGSSALENLRIAHWACNQARGNEPLAEVAAAAQDAAEAA